MVGLKSMEKLAKILAYAFNCLLGLHTDSFKIIQDINISANRWKK